MIHVPAPLRPLKLILLTLLLAFTCRHAMAAGDGDAEHRPCSSGLAIVHGGNQADFGDVCAGVTGALTFLAAHGLRPTQPVSIEVTASIPEEAGPTAAGCYIEVKRRVYIVPYATFRRHKTWFGVGITRELYRSLAAHEAAHAVSACHFQVPKPTIQAKEYIAYVAMFSSMSTKLRAQALQATRTVGFDSLDRFTPLLYMFDPMRFGAEAYRHFSSVANPAEVLDGILGGQALVD